MSERMSSSQDRELGEREVGTGQVNKDGGEQGKEERHNIAPILSSVQAL